MASRSRPARVAEGMDLPQVDVGVPAVQGAFQVAQQGPAGVVHDPLAVADDESGLGGDDHLVPVAQVLDQPADDPFRVPGSVRRCGVDQRAVGLAERLQQPAGLLGCGVAAPGHGAQAQAGHAEAGGADQA